MPMNGTIDTHQHFWKYNPQEYCWIDERMAVLKRDFLPLDLKPSLNEAGVLGTVAVQARQRLEETLWLLQLAAENPWILGVVGWVDLCSDQVERQLVEFARFPQFKGVRHVLHDEPDDRFMLRDDFLRGMAKLKKFELTFDLLVYPEHLPAAIELVKKFPEQPFVLNHIAKPYIKERELHPWDRELFKLAAFENVYCKISGLVTEADWTEWKQDDFVPFLKVALDAFGSGRILLGSDWPVCTVAGTYIEAMGIPQNFFETLSIEEQSRINRENARRFYRLESE